MSAAAGKAGGHALFEVSFEVCNKVGGIHTVLTTKAPTLVREYGDEYVLIGPWLLSGEERGVPFEPEPGFEAFTEACREAGLPVRVGRWTIPSRPRTVLIEFSSLYEDRDDVLAKLWERFGVDSIEGAWDYVEPVLFGYAAGKVIERWTEEFLAPRHRRAVAQFHEWMTGAGLLYLAHQSPSIGTVFTTHATMLGRALSSAGHSPEDGLGGRSVQDLAREQGVVAKHSLEGTVAREADVFTTVSAITAREAELLHERTPDPVLPNGIDLEVLDDLAGSLPRDEVRALLDRVAGRFLGEDVSDAAFVATSGRYEFHNKGIDLVLDSLARLEGEGGRRVVLFVLVPAGNSGLKAAYLEREDKDLAECEGPVGIATHNLFDAEGDPVHQRCGELGLDNAPGSRVKVIHVPIYLAPGDGFLDLSYEAVLRAMDLSTFPSYYEPWGYTPQESLALGVPTVTSDYAGFGRWAREQGLGPEQGVTVLGRVHRSHADIVTEHAALLESFLAGGPVREDLAATCREAAERTSSWKQLIANYYRAFEAALVCVQARLERGVPWTRRARQPLALRGSDEGARPRLVPFEVAATLPEPLRGLKGLARNYWWSWEREAGALFRDLSPDEWEACDHNPVAFLRRLGADELEARASDQRYVERLGAVLERFERYLSGAPRPESSAWGQAVTAEHPVAYFCAEFGLHESLPIYSGGLGVLAGDHLKSASDLGLPLVGVGLFYRRGYLEQRLTAAGEQVAVDGVHDPRDLPLERVLDDAGEPLVVRIALPSRELSLLAWRVAVGRVSLYLLDSDTPHNRPEDRGITATLYGGDEETRIQQEIVLGRGGARLLRRLGITPGVWHLNEGHAAFLCLERVSNLARRAGLTFEEAREVVRSNTVFTTHTPVPAGHDRFGEDLLRRYFSDAPEWVGVPWERFVALGRPPGGAEDFNMTQLALGFAGFVNGVSRIHAGVTRRLLHSAWPGLLESEVPVHSVTNGVHLGSWTAPEVAALVAPHGGVPRGEDFALRAPDLGARELWGARLAAKERLLDLARARLERSFVERDDSPLLLHAMLDGLEGFDAGEVLLIGFARRFAPYKRAQLLFQDPERLLALLDSGDRPVRVLVAGKAHPRDERGKAILEEIALLARSDEFAGRLVFLEGHDIALARALVQGVDLWLNTPTRGKEASGTSGMKAAANGVLNVSIGDGWWPEAADGRNGWTIGGERAYEDQALQDQHDAATLYRLLEEEIVPCFFDRAPGGAVAGTGADDEGGAGTWPVAWLERVRDDLATIPPRFNTDRMVSEYARAAYGPLAASWEVLRAGRWAAARTAASERRRLERGFAQIRILEARVGDLTELAVGDRVEVRVELDLAGLSETDLRVELVLGAAHAAADGVARQNGTWADLVDPVSIELRKVADGEARSVIFEGARRMESSGQYAYGIRVRARGAGETAGAAAMEAGREIAGETGGEALMDHGPGSLVRWV